MSANNPTPDILLLIIFFGWCFFCSVVTKMIINNRVYHKSNRDFIFIACESPHFTIEARDRNEAKRGTIIQC